MVTKNNAGSTKADMLVAKSRFHRNVGDGIADNAIDASIQAFPEMPSDNTSVMRAILKRLRPQDRHHVSYFAKDGKNYASDRATWSKMEREQAIDLKRNIFTDRSGRKIFAPPYESRTDVHQLLSQSKLSPASSILTHPLSDSIPPVPTNSGALRRVYSDAGWSYLDVSVYLPCAPSNFNLGAAVTGYIYTGGFGAQDDGIDAGFQYSPTTDSYSLFERDAATNGPQQMVASGPRFPCNQYASLVFYSMWDPSDGASMPMTTVSAGAVDSSGYYLSETVVDPAPRNGLIQAKGYV